MGNPFRVFELPQNATDEQIRQRYLELVRRYSPEHHPAKFAEVREAYEILRNQSTRLEYRLFEAGKNESIENIIEELTCRSPRRRTSLKNLLAIVLKP